MHTYATPHEHTKRQYINNQGKRTLQTTTLSTTTTSTCAPPNGNTMKNTLHKYRHSGFTITVTAKDYKTYIDTKIQKLTKSHTTSWHKELKRANTDTLFSLLARTERIIHDPQALSRAKYRLNTYIKKSSGLRTLPNFQIAYTYSHKVDSRALTKIVRNIIQHTNLSTDTKTHIQDMIRTTTRNGRSIAAILTNTNRECDKYDPQHEPRCARHAE